jgi:calcium-dependent protein kinase
LPLRNIVGTTYTCAPEVLKQDYDEKCDIWSVGVVSFILHCGQRPFDSDERLPTVKTAAIHRAILQGTYTFKYELWRDVSVDAKNFIKSCLEKNYKIRNSAAELLYHSWLVNGYADRYITSIGSKQTTRVAATLFAKSLSRSSGTGLKQVAMLAIAFEVPMKDVNHFRELFQDIDIDCNSYINREEFHVALQAIEPKLTAKVVDSKFDRVDQEGNGLVSFLEFVAAVLDVKELSKEQLNYAFHSLDEGSKGFITEEDIKRVLITNNTKPFIYKRIKDMIKYASRSNDNRVNKEDFLWTMVDAAPEESEYSYNQDVLGQLQDGSRKNGSKRMERRRQSDSGITLTTTNNNILKDGFNNKEIVVVDNKKNSIKQPFNIGTKQRKNTTSLVVVDRFEDSPQHVPEVESMLNTVTKPSQRRHSWAASKVIKYKQFYLLLVVIFINDYFFTIN